MDLNSTPDTPDTPAVFLDANVILYYLDDDSELQAEVKQTLQSLHDSGAPLYTSHHVIEEVMHLLLRLAGLEACRTAVKVFQHMDLALVEPEPSLDFVKRYVRKLATTTTGVNDALLLQLMHDAGITQLYTYDKAFARAATAQKIFTV